MGKQFLDQYSLLHFSQGVVAYFWGTPFYLWVITHASFEFLENTAPGMNIINKYLWFWPGGKPEADAPINVLGDNLSAIAGFLFSRYYDLSLRRKGKSSSHKND